jgi:hypothetical protein
MDFTLSGERKAEKKGLSCKYLFGKRDKNWLKKGGKKKTGADGLKVNNNSGIPSGDSFFNKFRLCENYLKYIPVLSHLKHPCFRGEGGGNLASSTNRPLAT